MARSFLFISIGVWIGNILSHISFFYFLLILFLLSASNFFIIYALDILTGRFK